MPTEHARVSGWEGGLIPHMVDRLARERPDAEYGLWPAAPGFGKTGYSAITYAQLANIVNGLAHWLARELDAQGKREVVAYMGPNDVRYSALTIAAVKAGHVVLLISPRNIAAAQKALFDSVGCRTFITSNPVPPLAHAVLDACKPRHLTIASVDEILAQIHPPFAYEKTFEEARSDPFVILHTSGSTGFPKPMIWTTEATARQITNLAQPVPSGMGSIDELCLGKRVISTLPPFHGAGFSQYFFNAIPFGQTIIIPTSSPIATAQSIADCLQHTPADVAILAPSVVSELGHSSELLDFIASRLKSILYIGGDLPQILGDRVAAKVPMRCQWGASEVGIPHQLFSPGLGPTEWRYTSMHPCLGAVFDQVEDGVHELVIRRNEALIDTQASFAIGGQEHLNEYRTKDLFEPHQSIPDTWCWRARADDILVFLNGEKTNPTSMEQHILAQNSGLSGALVVGAQRFQPALILEPAKTDELTTAEEADLISRVWPSVEEANLEAPAHARIDKSLIMVARPDCRFLRAGKGTIQRRGTVAMYLADIDHLYANADVGLSDEEGDESGPNLNVTSTEEVSRVIRDSILEITGWQGLDYSAGFFELGMDSLQALQLTRALRRVLHHHDLGLPTIYQNSSVSRLTEALMSTKDGEAGDEDSNRMKSLIDTYQALISQIPIPKSQSDAVREGRKPVDVLLTGSTGTLGTYILRALLNRPGIGQIFCLNRRPDGGMSAQTEKFAAAGFSTDLLNTRVTFLHADLSRPLLGLNKPTYEVLRDRVGLILHNAWPVNFHLSLTAFRPHLAGLVNLFSLAAVASTPARVLFVSSVAAVGERSAEIGPAPDAVLDLDSAYLNGPGASGYGCSKFIAETLCDSAARHLGLPVSIARVGQVAGASEGRSLWSRSEWFPSLVVSSMYLGCLPDSLGAQFSDVNWIPSDLLAQVILDLCLTPMAGEGRSGAEVFNLDNPHAAGWTNLLPVVVDVAQERLGKTLGVVSPAVWLDKLEQSESSTLTSQNGDTALWKAEAVANPAIKLLDFYQNVLTSGGKGLATQAMVVQKAVEVSPTMQSMLPVSVEWVRMWVSQWVDAN